MFQSTRPARGATSWSMAFAMRIAFQSTRPARGATRLVAVQHSHRRVSIHAPRAGRDRSDPAPARRPCSFNPRAPRGARLWDFQTMPYGSLFQSTRPARGATARTPRAQARCSCFNPRAPRGARLPRKPTAGSTACFNPRAPRGARPGLFGGVRMIALFQSTRPARGATQHPTRFFCLVPVSIHAPRAGRDVFSSTNMPVWKVFQSTRPARGATATTCQYVKL